MTPRHLFGKLTAAVRQVDGLSVVDLDESVSLHSPHGRPCGRRGDTHPAGEARRDDSLTLGLQAVHRLEVVFYFGRGNRGDGGVSHGPFRLWSRPQFTLTRTRPDEHPAEISRESESR